MKIKDVLQNYLDTNNISVGPEGYQIGPEILAEADIEQQLLKCDEFKNVKKLVILKMPIASMLYGDYVKHAAVTTFQLGEGSEFADTVYLYAILLSPLSRAAGNQGPVKDGVTINPLTYSKDLTPMNSLTMWWSQKIKQDCAAGVYVNKTEDDYVNDILENVKKALKNPFEYMAPEEKYIAVRCLPESVIVNESKEFVPQCVSVKRNCL